MSVFVSKESEAESVHLTEEAPTHGEDRREVSMMVLQQCVQMYNRLDGGNGG